ncbi:MAG: LPS assembly lipoprotein LptE [Woeseia sp.]
MSSTYIETADTYSLFYRKLRRELQSAGVRVVDSKEDASAVFSILSDETDQRVLSVSARNVPREYEVYYSVYYAVQAGNAVLMEPQLQTATRDYTYDETRVLGKSREEDLLRDAIANDLVRIVLIQLSAL